jgi:metallophosphoesterase (TIGR00282 family)
MRLLFIGDIMAGAGRRAVRELLPGLVDRHQVDLVVANAENAAGGSGITRETANELLDQQIAVLTGGNHTWRFKEAADLLERAGDRVLRPHNYPENAPGRGWTTCETASGIKVGVVNLQGRVFMDPLPSPFEVADRIVEQLREQTPIILVDMHAEATSEKRALGWYLDGRVSAVVGTHTHVQTADEEVLPGEQPTSAIPA